MIFNEWITLTKALKSVYTAPNFLPDEYAVKTWFELLKDLEYKECSTAIQKYMMTNKFPPTIADIREGVTEMTTGRVNDWGEGWEEVLKAIKDFGYINPKKALESLSPITRKCVERIGFTNICMSENIGVERANFRILYEQYAERSKKDAQIPAVLRQTIMQLQAENKLMLEDRNE